MLVESYATLILFIMKRNTSGFFTALISIILAFMVVGCGPKQKTENNFKMRVGLRLAGYREDVRKNLSLSDYPFCYQNLDYLYDRGARGLFKTITTYPEFYISWEEGETDTNPKTNPLVQLLANEEAKGEIYGVNIAREAMLGHPAGPISEDRRILYESDVPVLRKVIADAYEQGILKRKDYKLIQMLEEDNIFCNNERAKNIVKMLDGVALEVHHFNVHWPLDKGKIKIKDVVEGANWTLNQVNENGDSLEYVFYYGPFKGKDCEDYYPNVFQDWLYQFWAAGLPKIHPHMIYHINAFPHACGSSIPVGPESDPNSILGYTKWLIQELNPGMEQNNTKQER